MLLLYCTEHSSVGWWADYVTSRSLLSLILMITCLTSLAGLTFCTLFNSLYSYFLSYDSFWTKDPALQAACRPSCLSSVHMCVSQMPMSGEALTKQGLRHLCRHYSSSTTLYEPLWPQFCPNFYLLAICAGIHMSYVLPIFFEILDAQERGSFFCWTIFSSGAFHLQKDNTRTNIKKNPQPWEFYK